jgi:hypothetical protein
MIIRSVCDLESELPISILDLSCEDRVKKIIESLGKNPVLLGQLFLELNVLL